MSEEELQPLTPDPEETAEDPQAFAIRRVREVVAQTQVIHREPPPDQPEPAQKAKIDWQLHVWSGPGKPGKRMTGMSDMGGAQEARPRDGARARK